MRIRLLKWQVTRREYEVETSHGTTIKRRKTETTLMFQRVKCGNQQNHHPNIGNLFIEGSLNPYADDPYAFS
ncbi:hypothetical protein HanRHA438_Chr02g0087601 [Helianthus annuus]|nr:hypothetical protein HanIR_Chr02g0089151 [Helianthus annuus]KAJ0777959.1 hypothetical protein HanLR1_Chr02g0066451 [Helianthus annuus]KAJ0940808.1 hypothetical protein HanRHA438_Chr02g0087601 [Helianthus annuus]KAJ0952582.1 hypothetical protein HanPSC8_Chr02g0074011 [Helianthus annuus]